MKKLFSKLLLALVLFIMPTSLVLAQGVTTASISGQVSDPSGPVIGATIVAVHTPTNTTYGTTSGLNGNFTIQNMRIGGPYSVKVSYLGYQSQRVTDVFLELGQEKSFKFDMKEDATQIGEIVVTASQFGGVRETKSGIGLSIGAQSLALMPTVSRSINDFTRMLPQAGSQGLMGKGAKSNNLTVDGASFNNFMGLGGEATGAIPGGNAGAQPFALDAFDQIAVQASPYDVNVGGFTGAGINIVTKSGDNEFRASVYDYFRNQSLMGDKIKDTELTLPKYTENTVGFRVGGPIVKDKLFFFTNFEFTRNTAPITNIIANRGGQKGDNISNIQSSTLDDLSNFLGNTYNYNPGAYEGISKLNQSYKFLIKLDWNINKNNKFSIRYNQLTAKSLNGSTANSLSAIKFASMLYNRNNEIYGISAELNSKLSDKVSNRFIASYTSMPDYRSPYVENIFPLVNITDSGNTISFGTDAAAFNNRVDQKILQIQDDVTYLVGKNKFTAGFNWQYMNLSNNFTINPQGTFSYTSLANFYNNTPAGTAIPGGVSTGMGVLNQYSLGYTVQPGRTVTKSNPKVSQLGVYVQDEIAFTPKFTLSAGLRMDVISMIGEPKNNPEVPDMKFQWADKQEFSWKTTNTTGTKVLVSPRVGFNWGIDDDRRLNVKGGIGLFTGVIPFTFLDKVYANNGMNEGSINITDAEKLKEKPFNPQNGKYKPDGSKTPPQSYELDLVDTDFKMPQTLRMSLAADYRLPYDWTVGVEGVYSKDYHAGYYENVNLNQATAVDGPNGRLQYKSRQINGAVTGAYMLRSINKGSQVFLTASLRKSFVKGPSLSVAYTYGASKSPYDFLNTTASGAFNAIPVAGNPNIPMLGFSAFDLRHRIVADVSYRVMYGRERWITSVGLFINAAQQGRSSYTYSGVDVNGDGVKTNDLIYIPKNFADSKLVDIKKDGVVTLSAADQWTALDGYINSSDYLKSRRGKFAERNGLINPWYAQADLHFGQEFVFNKKNKQSIEFTIDILNLTNMINKNWGVIKVAANSAPITSVTADTFTVNPKNLARGEFVPFVDSSSAWSMMFGIRFKFN